MRAHAVSFSWSISGRCCYNAILAQTQCWEIMVFDSYLKFFFFSGFPALSLSLSENQILSSEGLKSYAVTFILLAEWITWLRYMGKWSDSSKFHRYKPPQGLCCNIQWFIWQLFACNKCLRIFLWNSGQFPWWRKQKKAHLGEEQCFVLPLHGQLKAGAGWSERLACSACVLFPIWKITYPVLDMITTVNNTRGIMDERPVNR